MLDAHAERILWKARKALTPSPLPNLFNDKAMPLETVSDERLQAAYEALASIVAAQGEQYIPLFKRLHAELSERQENKEYASIAKEIHLNLK